MAEHTLLPRICSALDQPRVSPRQDRLCCLESFSQKTMITIRPYRSTDCAATIRLFRHTIAAVNTRDYSLAQCNMWMQGAADRQRWDQSLRSHYTLVAEDHNKIVGFGDITEQGYVNRLFVSPRHQHKGIGRRLLEALECTFAGRLTTHSSITALPFFQAQGYQLLRDVVLTFNGVSLKSFLMEKVRPTPLATDDQKAQSESVQENEN